MIVKKRFLAATLLAISSLLSCKKTSTVSDTEFEAARMVALQKNAADAKRFTASDATRTLPCLVDLPIQQQFPPYQADVFPAVSAIGIPMSPLPADEFDLSKADDSDDPIDPTYNREFSTSDLSPETQVVMKGLNDDLERIANNSALMNSTDERPFLNATEEAFVKAERSAAQIKDDSPLGVKTTLDCINATKAKIRPTYAHLSSQACNFEETSDGTINNVTAARFWKKLGRAVLRVAATVVTTAVIVAAVVVVAKLTGGVGVAVAAKAAGTALIKGIAIGGFKLQPVLATASSFGIKNAYKNWDKPWQGASEFTFGVKLKW